MDENSVTALLFVAIAALLAIVFGVTDLCSEAKFRGWEEGYRESERYRRYTVDVLNNCIEEREHALAMYRDIATTFCDNTSDCMHCPYECDKNSSRCVLRQLNDKVDRFGIDEVHVDKKHDGVITEGR